jgi:hypothetical protein
VAKADDLKKLLESAGFGARVAEQELAELAGYFVETSQWRRLFAGKRDIVLGPKGSGKSALYSLTVQKAEELLDRNIIVQPAENPQGTPVFESVAADPPTSEGEFIGLWKLYFVSLVAEVLSDWDVQTDAAKAVYTTLEDADLRQPKATLARRLQAVREYVKRWFTPESLETAVALDPNTGQPIAVTGKITLREPSMEQAKTGHVALDELVRSANEAMEQLDFTVWIVLDRLDVAFANHEDLETNALRALFRTYLDMAPLTRIVLKIFLRNDIWMRVSDGKFVEGSHIDEEKIEWEPQGLRQLMLRRILRNQPIADYYGVDPQTVFASVQEQEALIARMLPEKIDLGKNPKTFDWMLTRTQDASGKAAPRELIHLLTSLRAQQIRRLELGNAPPGGELLFEREAFRAALKEVSDARLTKTLYAEYPDLKPYLELLRREKAQQSLPTLARIWRCDEEIARATADRLVQVGFWEQRGSMEHPAYWTPFLYREALELVMGEARI